MPMLKRPDAEIYYEIHGAGFPVLLYAPGGLGSRVEILGVVVAGLLAVLCLVWGMSTLFGNASPEADINKDAQRIRDGRMRAERPAATPKKLAGNTEATPHSTASKSSPATNHRSHKRPSAVDWLRQHF